MQEQDTRLVPIEHSEVAYALNRATAERSPYPTVGDRVFFRHREWDVVVHPAVIRDVQDAGDRTDPWLWHTVKDVVGRQHFAHGVPRFVPVADPWPWVVLDAEIGGGALRTDDHGDAGGGAGRRVLVG